MMLTVVEVAVRLRISRTCVYQLVDSRRLGSHRIGVGRGTIRISEEDLAAYVEIAASSCCPAGSFAASSAITRLPSRPRESAVWHLRA
jgi:excisionase family DNA binding protein